MWTGFQPDFRYFSTIPAEAEIEAIESNWIADCFAKEPDLEHQEKNFEQQTYLTKNSMLNQDELFSELPSLVCGTLPLSIANVVAGWKPQTYLPQGNLQTGEDWMFSVLTRMKCTSLRTESAKSGGKCSFHATGSTNARCAEWNTL